ncbi:MAG TPA: hypothetical protein VM686_32495, partial [Polyangiaceae bacterium]|nr:hypothetical protein [Polyangiaceae bacterium]
MLIEGRTELERSDFGAASRTRLTLLGRLALAIVVVFLVPALLSSKPVHWVAWLYPPMFVALVLVIIMFLGRGAWATSAFRSAVGDGSRQATFRLSDRGLEVETSARRTDLAWADVQR